MIYRYISQGSIDAYSWQILETKQKFISQFLSGSSYQRTASDLENNVLTYGQVKALALSQPLMKKLAEKEKVTAELQLHSDQGFQYTSQAYFNLTKSYGITHSMSRRENPYDNAMLKTFSQFSKQNVFTEQS